MRWTPGSHFLIFPSASTSGVAVYRANVQTGELETLPRIASGAHMSFSPDRSLVLDVVGHKTLWVYPLPSGEPRNAFEFPDADIRIDYPSWSPDGRQAILDRVQPQGGEHLAARGIELKNALAVFHAL
jgi:Tol biopolymer transport system component